MNTSLLTKYSNKWVALTPDRGKVIAAASNLKVLDKKIRQLQKRPNVIYHHVLPINGNYSP